MLDTLPLLLKGMLTTIKIWLGASLVSFIFGLSTGIIRSRKLRIPLISSIADFVTLVLRGLPLYAQLMLAYFGLPQAFGINFSALATGIVTLGMCSGSYASEIVRGSLNAIPHGQWLASHALGYSRWQQLRYVIVPQMFLYGLPALINEYVMVLKSTSILASIGILELTKMGLNIMYRSFEPLGICMSIAAIYLALTLGITAVGKFIERKMYAQRSQS